MVFPAVSQKDLVIISDFGNPCPKRVAEALENMKLNHSEQGKAESNGACLEKGSASSPNTMEPEGLMRKGLVVGQLKPSDVCRKHRSRTPSPSGIFKSVSSLDLMSGKGCGNSGKKPRMVKDDEGEQQGM